MMTAAGGAGLNVENVFGKYFYYGGSSTPTTITNNIDLANEGGLVWIKGRNVGRPGCAFDTERGANKYIELSSIDDTQTEDTNSGLSAFNSNGFTLQGTDNRFHHSSYYYLSYSFRKASKFFDVISWSGNGTAGRTISHSLGSVPGFIIFKAYDDAENWTCWHNSFSGAETIPLDNGVKSSGNNILNNTAPSSSVITLGDHKNVNASGTNYVAYVWAHNNNDGNFGPNGDQDIIKCGSYTGNGGGSYKSKLIDLGFEPDFIMIKRTDANSHNGNHSNWVIKDDYLIANLEGSAGNEGWLLNKTNEIDSSYLTNGGIAKTHTQIRVDDSNALTNVNNGNFIYMAIRRGPMGEPSAPTDVYAQIYGSDVSNPKGTNVGLVPDTSLASRTPGTTYEHIWSTRGISSSPFTGRNSAGQAMFSPQGAFAGKEQGYYRGGHYGYTDVLQQVWKRWSGIYDYVYYDGTGSQRTIAHQLGVVPELMIIKKIDGTSNWVVYHKDMGTTGGNPKVMHLNNNQNSDDQNSAASATFVSNPTDSVFTVGTDGTVNTNNGEYICHLFATKDGFSSVGSYTGNGSSQTINMGFSAGAKWFVTKRIDSGGNWLSFNSERSIVAGTDVVKYLNLADFAEGTGNDWVDPTNSGIIVNTVSSDDANVNGGTYIYWAYA